MPTQTASDKQKFRKAAKKALVEREVTITDLADRIGRTREAVSQAINHMRFPKVVRLVKEELELV